jgi:hypothetical protein
MAIFSAIFDLLNTANLNKVADYMQKNRNANGFSSIASKASEGILQFPVIMSNSIDYDTAVIITKTCERSYANFVQIVFSMNKDMGDVNASNVSQYLRRFHDNNNSSVVDTTKHYSSTGFGKMQDMATGNYNSGNAMQDMGLRESFSVAGKNGVSFKCEMYYPQKPMLSKELKDSLKPYIENFCLTKLNDLYKPMDLKKASFAIPMFEADGYVDDRRKYYEKYKNDHAVPFMTYGKFTDDMYHYYKYLDDNNLTEKDLTQDEYNNENNSRNNKERNIDHNRTDVNYHEGGRDVKLEPNEVKKTNEMQPTMIRISIDRVDADARQTITYNFLIGIKATLHAIPSDEFVSNMVDACEYKGKLFRFIKWYTGEIEFMRDFVLNMDQFGKDVQRRAAGESHWWNTLKRRARDAKISRVQTDRILPNTTLVLNRSEVEYVKANYGYDLMDRKIVARIMEEYFLLGYIVVDMASEIAYIMYDGQKDFQELTFRSLERDNVQSERAFKDMLRAAKKM